MTATTYSSREEFLHALSHGFGVFVSVVGMLVLVQRALVYGDDWHLISALVYGTSLILLYLSSTLYHASRQGIKKIYLRKLDHAIIYVMIAGSYTPLTLVSLRHNYGWAIFAVIWSLALAGLYLEIFAKQSYRKTAIALYLIMGWLIIIAARPLAVIIPDGGLSLLFVGGLCYTFGVAFYIRKKMPYHHVIWHLFVLAGSAFHYFAFLFYVYP